MFAGTLKDIQFPVEKQNLYIRNNLSTTPVDFDTGVYIPLNSLSYVGECLINIEDHTVHQIGKNIKYTPTQDLIEMVLTEYGRFTPHIIYYSKDKSDVCINAILGDKSSLKVTLENNYMNALEICNYYSGRYSPKVFINLYNVSKDLMIRTPYLAFNGEGHKIKISLNPDIDLMRRTVLVDYDVAKLLPKRYLLPNGKMTFLTALNNVAELCLRWLETNYELATATQRKIYNILLTKIIED